MINKFLLAFTLVIFQLCAYAQQTYQLDIKKSKILWKNQKTMGKHFGYVLLNSGSLNYSSTGQPLNGTFSMNMNTLKSTDHDVEADNQRVDKELRSPGFFDIDKYPAATMVVKEILPFANSTKYKVKGDLTIKGITNPIEFTATLNKKGTGLYATAQFDIDRLLWHINLQPEPKKWDLFATMKNKMIADEIQITLNLVFKKAAK